MAWNAQIPVRTGWYWIRTASPNEKRVVFLDYQTSRVYDGRRARPDPRATPIFDFLQAERGVEWYSPELRPPPM